MVLEGLPDDFRMDPAIQNSTRKLQQQNDTNNHGKIVQSSWLDAKLKLPQSESKNLGELFKKHLENKHPENNNKIEKIWGQNVPKSNAGWGDESEIKKSNEAAVPEDRKRHLDEIKRIEEKLKAKAKAKLEKTESDQIPVSLENWGKVEGRGDTGGFNREIWSDANNKLEKRNFSNDDFDTVLGRLNEPSYIRNPMRDSFDGFGRNDDFSRNDGFDRNREVFGRKDRYEERNMGFGRDFDNYRRERIPENFSRDYKDHERREHYRGGAQDDFYNSNNNSGQQVGYRMRDLQTGQVTLFNPKADADEKVFVPQSSRSNARSERQNWPPYEDRYRNPMYGDYEHEPYYDSRGEYFPNQQPRYQDYRNTEQFYDVRDPRRYDQGQSMFPSDEWNSHMNPENYYWNQSKDQQPQW